MENTELLYIGGHGRSGTTIVERIFARGIGAFSAGEVHRFWEYGISKKWKCACNEELTDCPFWGEVLGNVTRRMGIELKDIVYAWRKVARPKSIPFIFLPSIRTSCFSKSLDLYTSFLSVFYNEVSSVSGRKRIVDSSGSAIHGCILSRVEGVDVSMVHLVRDPRAVANSNKRVKNNPASSGNNKMSRKGVVRTSISWRVVNRILDFLREKQFENCTIARYEDLFLNPSVEFSSLADKIGLEFENKKVFKNFSTVVFEEDHMGQGNPIRYKNGEIDLYVDDKWKREMRYIDRLICFLMCYDVISEYKYKE